MSIESDIVTATAGVAIGTVAPWVGLSCVFPAGEVTEDVQPPFVAYRRTLYEPVIALGGPYGLAHSEFTFECWGKKTDTVTAKQASLTLAIELRAAIEASATLAAANRFEIATPGDQYDPDVLEVMEPVSYSFWHSP